MIKKILQQIKSKPNGALFVFGLLLIAVSTKNISVSLVIIGTGLILLAVYNTGPKS